MSKIELTESQVENVINEWNSRPDSPPSLLELIRIAFPDESFDGRSKEGRSVKDFLATRKIKARGAHEYKPKDKIELTEDHKEFIRNNASYMSPTEIARVIFTDEEITPLHQETRAVGEYAQTADIQPFENPREPSAIAGYKPPGTFDRTLSRVNKYIFKSLDKNKMTPKQKKDIEALTGYLNTYRFIHQINSYTVTTNRELFESSFVRYTHDKYELTQEEVDQYIVLSTEVVIASDIQARVERLQRLLDDVASDTEGRRISMSLVDAIGTSQQEYNQCINRQNKLLNDLKEKRSDKLKKQMNASASILNLVEMWKSEENRIKLVNLANLRKQVIKEEIESLTDMDEVRCKILGLTEGEVLNE